MRGASPAAVAMSLTLLLIGAAYADGDAARGEARFQDCAACHKLEAGTTACGSAMNLSSVSGVQEIPLRFMAGE